MMNHPNKLPRFGQRHVLVLIANMGLILVYCIRVNLSVALVAMINKTETNNMSSSGECSVTTGNSSVIATPNRGEFEWSRELQGYILSAFFWGYITLQVPGGSLAQKFGGKWIFGIGILWTALLTFLTPLAARTNVYLVIALRFLEGVGESVTYPAILAMLGRWTPREEINLMFSLTLTGGIIGIIIGQAISGPLCASNFLGGWPSVFYLSGGLGVLWFIPWCFLAYNSPEKHPRISMEERDYILNSIGTSQEDTNKKSIPWKRILLSRYVWSYVVAQTVSGWVTYTMLTCLPQFLSDVLHFNIADNGLVASAPYISFGVLTNIFAWLCDAIVSRHWFRKTITKKFFTAVSLGGCGVCLFGITFISCDKVLVIVLLVVSYSLYSAANAGYASVSLDLSPEYSGTVFGIGNIFTTAAGIGTPLLTDYITADHTIQEWNIVFYVSSAAGIFGMLQFIILGSTQRQEWAIDSDDLGAEESDPLVVN